MAKKPAKKPVEPSNGDGVTYLIKTLDGRTDACVFERGRFENGDAMYQKTEVAECTPA